MYLELVCKISMEEFNQKKCKMKIKDLIKIVKTTPGEEEET